MCDAMAVGIGVQGVSTLVQMNAIGKRGAAAKDAAFRDADVALRAAADAVQSVATKEAQVSMHGQAVVAAQRVAQSGSGADLNVGSPADVREATGAISEADRRTVVRNAQLHALGLTMQARGDYQRGAYAEAEAKNEALGTFLGGIGKITGKAGSVLSDIKIPTDERGELGAGPGFRDRTDIEE